MGVSHLPPVHHASGRLQVQSERRAFLLAGSKPSTVKRYESCSLRRIDYPTCMGTRIRSICLLSIVFVTSLCCTHVAYSQTPPCALLTQDQVRTILGATDGAGSPIAN